VVDRVTLVALIFTSFLKTDRGEKRKCKCEELDEAPAMKYQKKDDEDDSDQDSVKDAASEADTYLPENGNL
tara:strand:+ start:711 stop:923 length:213 start_codon:yes stop_codon:yes gene_type:complete